MPSSELPLLSTYVPILVALLGSAGLWGYLAQRNKLQYEKEQQDEARLLGFNAALSTQINRLSDKIDILTKDKEQLLIDMAGLKAQLAEAHATIKHLEELLRQR